MYLWTCFLVYMNCVVGTFIWRDGDVSGRLDGGQLRLLRFRFLHLLFTQVRFDVFRGFNSLQLTLCPSLRL